MDSQPEVSSTMTEDAEVVIEIEVSPSRNGISLAEAANALITLQVPSKDNSAVHSPKVGEDQKVSADDINPKDVRKKILEGMKSQFNTNAEEDVVQEQTSRRGPHRSKSKFKLHEYDNDDDSVDVGTKPDNPKQSRGRGRPPRLIPPHDKSTLMTNGVKIEPSGKSEKDSSSEAGSERGDSLSISSGAITTRRSQRANISRTSATDLLKGLTDSRTARKHIASPDADVNKSQDPPRKRGRPSKSATPVDSKVESVQADPDPVVLVTEPVEERRPEDDVSKVEHMASLGLLSKANTELSVQSPDKKLRRSDSPVENQQSLNGSVSGITKISIRSFSSGKKTNADNVEELRGESEEIQSAKENLTAQEVIGNHHTSNPEGVTENGEKPEYACCCSDSRSPVVVTSPAVSLYCQAYDSVGGKLVGCCLIASRKRLYRSSKKIAFMILCDSHRDRMRKHFCCPGCGLFCTQGTFFQCSASEGSVHFFHESCLRPGQKSCLHCHKDTAISEARLQVKTCATPVFCSDPKLLRATPTAKISCAYPLEMANGKNEVTSPNYPSPQLVLPSGKVIDISSISSALSKEILERILKSFDNCSKSITPNKNLFFVSKNGDIEKVVDCLKQGQNVNLAYREFGNRTALHAAAASGHLAIVHILVQSGAALDKFDQSQNTALTLAISQEQNNVVKYLIQAGCSTVLKGEGGMTPLHLASKQGNLEACHYIITLGNGLKAVNTRDDGGWTPLVWGCEHKQINIVRYLLKCRADPKIRDAEQNVALHWAAFSGSDDIVTLLLDNDCEVNTSNFHGDTPLHTASRRDNYECVFLFISRGARLDLRNNDGQTPLDVCPNKDCHSAFLLTLNMKLKQHIQSSSGDAEKIVSNDVSRGKEMNNPIQCVNAIDDETTPTDFFYVTENCFTSPLHVDRTINSLMYCQCSGDCSIDCKCSNLSFQCWYDEEGKLTPDFNFSDPPMLFECNRACQCHIGSCSNRVVQHGITMRLVLFRAKNKGWGVRTSQAIPRGSYVCEYIGEVITDFEADQREDDSYLFDLDNKDGETYCIDARRYGNIARFINHSCDPNLVPVKVYVDHQDLKFPRIAFFASRDIASNEELAFDYGEKFWIIKYKSFTCACLSENCKYSEDTIQRTVEEYRRSLQLENGFAQS